MDIRNNNLKSARGLIEKEPDIVNKFDHYDRLTPLHWACFMANVEMVELLIKHKANVNARGGGGNAIGYDIRPLHAIMRCLPTNYSVKLGIADTIISISKLLIASGSEVDPKSGHGYTPFMNLVLNKGIVIDEKIVIAQFLTSNNANINAHHNESILGYAMKLNEWYNETSNKLIEYLKSNGAV